MIVITTMDSLPEHCYECPCHDGESGYCQADKEQRYSDYRPFWCPLIRCKVCTDCAIMNCRNDIIGALNKHDNNDLDEKPLFGFSD